jgi:hypothetical protein
MAAKTRTVEYFRGWAGNGGDSGTWDTDYVDIPADTPDDKVQQAIEAACARIEWRDGEAPVLVGLYGDGDDPDAAEAGDDFDGLDEHGLIDRMGWDADSVLLLQRRYIEQGSPEDYVGWLRRQARAEEALCEPDAGGP